jgi:hypothetical protein
MQLQMFMAQPQGNEVQEVYLFIDILPPNILPPNIHIFATAFPNAPGIRTFKGNTREVETVTWQPPGQGGQDEYY